MSCRGNPCDKPQAESFMKTLRVEAVYLAECDAYEDAAATMDRAVRSAGGRAGEAPCPPGSYPFAL